MKKLLLFVLTFLSIHFAWGQDPEKTKVDFGLKVGVNVGGIEGSYDDELNANYKVSLHGGFFLSYPLLRDRLSFQFEALFSGKGYKADVFDSLVRNSITHNLFYLDLPFILNLELGSGWAVHAGFQYSILIFEEYVNFTTERKDDLQVSNNDYGIVAGVSYDVDKKNQIGIRYIYGLPDIMEYQNSTTAHSSLFQAYVAFTLF